jgi:hypothetical protein
MTRAECTVFEASGVWDQQRLELVAGDMNVLVAVQAWLVRTFGEQFVNPEAPIDVAPEDNPTNEPEPDLVVLAKPSREFRNANPRPADLRLVVEISDSAPALSSTGLLTSRPARGAVRFRHGLWRTRNRDAARVLRPRVSRGRRFRHLIV